MNATPTDSEITGNTHHDIEVGTLEPGEENLLSGNMTACLDLQDGKTFYFDEEPLGLAPAQGPFGFYPMTIGETLENLNNKRYEVVRKLGWGTSASVWLARVRDHISLPERYVAVKILTVVHTSTIDSEIGTEFENLKRVAAGDSNHAGFRHCLQLDDVWFSKSIWGSHFCFSTQILGRSLAELRRQLPKLAFSVPVVKRITKQTLMALDYIHNECGLVHTDIKPDNTLVIMDASDAMIAQYIKDHPSLTYDPVMEPQISPNPINTIKSQPLPNFGLNDDFSNIVVCLGDFGQACPPFYWASREVQSRPLRAPEVNLGYRWSFEIDIWTVGCLVFEYLVGSSLFRTERTVHSGFIDIHLRRILEHLGPIPESFIEKCSWRKDFFKKDGTLWAPEPMHPRPLEDCIRNYQTMSEEDIPAAGAFIRRCLTVDPTLRPPAAELMKDEWLADV